MFGYLPVLCIQLKTRPYYMEHTNGDAQFINGPKPTQAEILECLKSMRDQLDKVHESAAKNISNAQAKQAKNYGAHHIGKLLSVSTKVMVKDRVWEARKGDKLKVPFWGPYTICEVLPKGNCALRDKHGKRLVSKFCISHLKVYMELDHVFMIDAIDMLPVPYCDESSDEERKAQCKGPAEKMPDLSMPPTDPEEKILPNLQVPATPPKSLSQRSHETSIQVPKSPSQLSTMSKLNIMLSVQVVCIQEGLKFQFLPLDDDHHTWLCEHVQMKNRVPSIKHDNVGQFLEGPPLHTMQITGDGNCLFCALVFAITGHQTGHKKVQQDICRYIEEHSPYTGEVAPLYLQQTSMKEDKIYGTDLELYAAVQLLGRDLYVYYRYGEHQVKWLNFPCSEKGVHKGRQSIYLDNRFDTCSDGHFDYVLSA